MIPCERIPAKCNVRFGNQRETASKYHIMFKSLRLDCGLVASETLRKTESKLLNTRFIGMHIPQREVLRLLLHFACRMRTAGPTHVLNGTGTYCATGRQIARGA